VWGEWIEMLYLSFGIKYFGSLPVWGEWIEIEERAEGASLDIVSPRVGRVD